MIENLASSPTGKVIGAIIGVIVTVVIIYRGFIISKRPQRLAELWRLIDDIKDPRGADNAMELFNQCLHIVQHYGISFEEVGFEDRHDLEREATQSLARGLRRKERQRQEVATDADGFPTRYPSP